MDWAFSPKAAVRLVQGQFCLPRDPPNDLAGALSGTWQEPHSLWGFPGSAAIKSLPVKAEDTRDAGLRFRFDPLEEEMATHSSVLAWRIPGTGQPSGLLSMGSQRVGHD